MKTISILCLAFASLLVVLNHAAEYWLGYSESSQALLASGPIFIFGAESILFLVFVFLALSTYLTNKHRAWCLSMVVIFWPLVILTFVLLQIFLGSTGALIVRGLHDRVMHDYTLNDLRQFAKDVDQARLIKVGWINHGDLSYLTDDQKAVFYILQKKYPFMLWMNDGRILHGPSIANFGDDNIVNFEWGGALPGHWGCSISIDGSKNEPEPDPDRTLLRVSDDIYFYFGD